MTDPTTPRPDDPVSSALVAACEQAWSDIKKHHPELPDAVIVLGTGMKGGRLVKLGHWWQSQWMADGKARAEVLLAGEALHLPADDVLEILLHEAAHGINSARGLKDTSRGGRYHNEKYKITATEVGLHVERADPYGWAKTTLTPASRERYAHTVERIQDHLRIARTLPAGVQRSGGLDGKDRDGTSSTEGGNTAPKNPAAACSCGRKMRMANSVLAQGPVVCGLCKSEFVKPRQAEHTTTAASPSDGDDFLRRRAIKTALDSPDRSQEGRRHLDAIGRALARVAADGDPEPLEVFERDRDDIERWFDDLVSAEVLHLPAQRHERYGPEPPEREAAPDGHRGIDGVEL